MTIKLKLILQIAFFVLLAIAWVSYPAYATNNRDGTRVEVEQEQAQQQQQQQQQEQTATGGEATASNDGNNTEINSHTENNSSNIVLVPNNNTENCLRVFGIAWGKSGESGALGIPWRSGKCDVEAAADDAFAGGERELGWFWKCQNANLYKKFKEKGETNEQASQQCLDKMVGSVTQLKTIDTLRSQLDETNQMRETDRRLARESQERITEACNESKNRILESCKGGK